MLCYRSVLYLPANNARALAKVPSLAADAFIVDLEDAVAAADKAPARRQLAQWLAARPDLDGRALAVRINADASMDDDLAALTGARIDALVCPKVESVTQLVALHARCRAQGIECPIWAMLETPLGILQAQTLAASGHLSAMILGTNDLGAQLDVRTDGGRLGLLYAMSSVVLAAKAYGLAVWDGVYNALDDESGLRNQAVQAKTLGFTGKTAIHPRQLALINAQFSPSEASRAQAQRMISAWKAGNTGVMAFEGQMVEAMHVEAARRLLNRP